MIYGLVLKTNWNDWKNFWKIIFKIFSLDVDECRDDRDACDMNQICVNQIGGFRCDCKVGFQLDSITNACEGKYF